MSYLRQHGAIYIKLNIPSTIESASVYFGICFDDADTQEDFLILENIIQAKDNVMYNFQPYFTHVFMFVFPSLRTFISTYEVIASNVGVNLKIDIGNIRNSHVRVLSELYKHLDGVNDKPLCYSIDVALGFAQSSVNALTNPNEEEKEKMGELFLHHIHIQRAVYATRYFEKNQK